MKTVLLLLAAFACYGSSIVIPGESELVVYNFDGSTGVTFGADFSAFAQDQRQQLAADPKLVLPRFGIYDCTNGCSDYTGLHFAAYGPGVNPPPVRGGTETPEPATWSLLLGAIGCFGIARLERRKA